jgi:hypothetical protein
MPAMGAIAIVLTPVLLFLAIPRPALAYCYLISVICLLAASGITRFFNQKINRDIMTWNLNALPANWQTVRTR